MEAVTLDCWGTLFAPTKPLGEVRLELWQSLAVDLQVDVNSTLLLADFAPRYRLRRVAEPSEDPVAAATSTLLTMEPKISKSAAVELGTAYARAIGFVELRYADGLLDALSSLSDAGLILGVISNVHATTGQDFRAALDRAAASQFITFAAFSDELGVFKPDAAIFHTALKELGNVPPHRAVHIGDSVRFDIEGAHRAGMHAVRVNEFVNDEAPTGRPDADFVACSLIDAVEWILA